MSDSIGAHRPHNGDHQTSPPVSPERLDELISLTIGRDTLRCLIELKEKRTRHQGIEFLFEWMRTPNPQFGGVSPEQMILIGQGHKLVNFINEAREDYEATASPQTPV